MRRFSFGLAACAALMAVWAISSPAKADIVIAVSKSSQRMTVMVNGRERYHWPVSTGVGGGPPSGHFRPERMERMWHSRTYDWSPMPHSIFFHKGFAIHGTKYLSQLGRPASHGCVRLHPAHAAALFALVREHGADRTRIAISGSPMLALRR